MLSHFTCNQTEHKMPTEEEMPWITWTIRMLVPHSTYARYREIISLSFVGGVINVFCLPPFDCLSIHWIAVSRIFSSISCSSQFTTMYFRSFPSPPFGGRSSHSQWHRAYESASAQYTCSFPKINYAIYSHLLIPSSLSMLVFIFFAAPVPLLCIYVSLCEKAEGSQFLHFFFCLLLRFRLFL